MEKLAAEKQAEVSKMSTEHLRARLIKAGYDKNNTVEMECGDLLNTYAEYLVTPSLPESPEKAEAVGGMSKAEIEFRGQELEIRRQQLEWRQAEAERQRQKEEEQLERQRKEKEEELERRRKEREEDLEIQRQRDELQRKEKEEELERRRQ